MATGSNGNGVLPPPSALISSRPASPKSPIGGRIAIGVPVAASVIPVAAIIPSITPAAPSTPSVTTSTPKANTNDDKDGSPISAVVSSRPHSRGTFDDNNTPPRPTYTIIADTVPAREHGHNGNGATDIGEMSGAQWDTTMGEESVGNIVGLSAVGVDTDPEPSALTVHAAIPTTTTAATATSTSTNNNNGRSDSESSLSLAMPSLMTTHDHSSSLPPVSDAHELPSTLSYHHDTDDNDNDADDANGAHGQSADVEVEDGPANGDSGDNGGDATPDNNHMHMMDDTERSVSVSVSRGDDDGSELPSGVNSMSGHYLTDGHGNLLYADGTLAARSHELRLMGTHHHHHHMHDPDTAAYYFTQHDNGSSNGNGNAMPHGDGYYDEGNMTQAMLDAGYLVDGSNGGEYELSHAQHAHLYHLHQRLLAAAAAGHLSVTNAHTLGEEEPEDEDDGDDENDPTKGGGGHDDDMDDDEGGEDEDGGDDEDGDDDDDGSDDGSDASDDDHPPAATRAAAPAGDTSDDDAEKEEWKKPRIVAAGTTATAVLPSKEAQPSSTATILPTGSSNNSDRVMGRKLTGVTDLKTAPSPTPHKEETKKPAGDSKRFRRFFKWMHKGGAKFPHLILQKYAKDYRGVHITTKNDIPKGKILLKIPRTLLITVELAKASPIGKLLSQLPNLGSQALLAVYLLQERLRGRDSFWRPWISVMPKQFGTLPMFFNHDELAMLTGSDELLLKVASQKKSMQEEYSAIQKLKGIQKFKLFSYDDFVWACLAVGTRVFSLCINGIKTSVLAPLADMMNHKNPSGTNWTFDTKKDAFTLTSCVTLGDGDAVYESYGAKDNKRFFASYGFVLEDNPANEVTVCIPSDLVMDKFGGMASTSTNHGGAPSSNGGAVTPGSVSRQANVVIRQFTVHACYDAAAEELMSFLRIANAHDYQLEELDHSMHRPFTGPISVDNELSALYALRCACKDHLRAYTTTLEDDYKLLQSPEYHRVDYLNRRNCVLFRIGEKRIYRFFVDWVTTAISLLCVPWEEAKSKIRKIMDPSDADVYAASWGFIPYITNIVVPLLQERHHATLRKKQALQQQDSKNGGTANRGNGSTTPRPTTGAGGTSGYALTPAAHQIPPSSASASSLVSSSYTASVSSRRDRGPGHWKGMEEYEGVKVVDGEPPSRVFEGTELLQRMERERLAAQQQAQQQQQQHSAMQQLHQHYHAAQLGPSASTVTLASTATLSSGASVASLRATPAGLRTSTPSSVGPTVTTTHPHHAHHTTQPHHQAHHHVRETPPPRGYTHAVHHGNTHGKEYYQPPASLAAAARHSTAGSNTHQRRRVVPARGAPPSLVPIAATVVPPQTAPHGHSRATYPANASVLPVLSPNRSTAPSSTTSLAMTPPAHAASTAARSSPKSAQVAQRSRRSASPAGAHHPVATTATATSLSSIPAQQHQQQQYYEQPQPISVTPNRRGNFQPRAGGSAPYPSTTSSSNVNSSSSASSSSSTPVPHQRSSTVPTMPALPSTPRRTPSAVHRSPAPMPSHASSHPGAPVAATYTPPRASSVASSASTGSNTSSNGSNGNNGALPSSHPHAHIHSQSPSPMQHSAAVAPSRPRYSASPLRPIAAATGGAPVNTGATSNTPNNNGTVNGNGNGRHGGQPIVGVRPSSGNTYYNHPQHKATQAAAAAAALAFTPPALAPLLPPLSTNGGATLLSPSVSMSLSPSTSAASQPPSLSPLGPMTANGSPSAPLILSPNNNIAMSPLSMNGSTMGTATTAGGVHHQHHQQSVIQRSPQRFGRATSNDNHNMVAVA